ncbi:hypothetical protein Tco_0061981 [Tanacetum coccineum]
MILDRPCKGFLFYYTLLAAIDSVIPDPTLDDLDAGTPSANVIPKAEASKKLKASLSSVAPSHVAKRTRSGGGSVPPGAEGLLMVLLLLFEIFLVMLFAWTSSPFLPVLTMPLTLKIELLAHTIVDQFPTPREMVWIKALTNDQLTAKMTVLHCLMMPYRGELFA